MSGREQTPVLETRELCRRFGEVQALRQLSFAVHPAEIYGLVGCDGAGKTTTMRMLAGLMRPDSGQALVLGQNPLGAPEALRRAVGYMPQHYSLYGDLTVAENLRFFSRMFCQSRAEFRERRGRLLQITRLGPFTDRRADALSGGMYKKLALACSLLPRPRVLLLDEPTNGVDPVSRRELWALLFELVADGMAILLSTAYMDEAARCHRVGLIHGGQLLREGPPRELLDHFSHTVLQVSGERPLDTEQERRLERNTAVVAFSVAGRSARLVLRAQGLAAVEAALSAEGFRCEQVPPSFEDLFIAETSGPQQQVAS